MKLRSDLTTGQENKLSLTALVVSNNYEALPHCLQAILIGEAVPPYLAILLNGDDPPDSYYYRQMLNLAKIRKVAVLEISLAEPLPIREARDFLIKSCTTNFGWFVDDDVIPSPYCLKEFKLGISGGTKALGYYQGSKADVSNSRGYKDYSREWLDDLTGPRPVSGMFDPRVFTGDVQVSYLTMDSGNVVIDLPVCNHFGIKFKCFHDSVNSGGSDATFAIQCTKAKLMRMFIPAAQSFHLEKPVVNFTDSASRKEMVIQACHRLDVDPKAMKQHLFPWIT